MPTDIFLLGAGGHGKVVLDALYAGEQPAIVFDADPDKSGTMLLKNIIHHLPGDYAGLPEHGHVAIGDNQVRKMLATEVCGAGASLRTVLHPCSVVAESSEIREGCFVAASAVIGPGALVERGTIVNHGSVVDHDCDVGSYCHIAPNVTLGGRVKLDDGVLVGSGAVILPGIIVGANAIIGAGAVVTCNVEANTTVVGMPARVKQR